MAHHDVAGQTPDPHDPQTSRGREPGILRLQPSLRTLIYEFIGVRGSTASELADEGGGRIFNLNGPRRLEQPQIGFHGLLVSCRVLYREVSRLLYATNRFTIRFSDRQSLEPLRNLRPPTCASLTHLKVILAETSCHFTGPTSDEDWVFGIPCCRRQYALHCVSDENHRHDDPIVGLDPRLNEWASTISYLASAIRVGILDLAVVCDVCPEPTKSGMQAARSVTMSLLRLPRLKECSVRLCHEPDQQLQQLAHETALFLVCKTLYKDAQAVFYSGNRFVVFDRHSDPPWNREVERDSLVGADEGYPYPRLGASIFLRERVPEDCLPYLRFLELVFPAWDHDVWPTEGQGVLQDWKHTLEWARDKLNVGGLTVRLIAMDASDWEQPLSRRNMTREQGLQVISGYMRLLGPLVCLGELRRFYAQLVSPWRWNEGGQGSTKAVMAMERVLKERAEKMLMGERYMLVNHGCKEPSDSVWHYQYERDA
ncbi:hypothetical protein VMCG_07038 [Cytospora schulzeri]|uniref:Uncharacterized protein n=1 Tax=Cytospora schulzeri TaxID=448051 RepID=A0A423W432_9PEZI|nr:hypothetical protein VMCG_07038 [Valsa malicola]